MAESIKEKLDIEEIGIKEKIVYNQEAILPSSTVEDTCTVYLQEEDLGMDATEVKGKQWRKPIIYAFTMNIYIYLNIYNIYLYLSLNKNLSMLTVLGA